MRLPSGLCTFCFSLSNSLMCKSTIVFVQSSMSQIAACGGSVVLFTDSFSVVQVIDEVDGEVTAVAWCEEDGAVSGFFFFFFFFFLLVLFFFCSAIQFQNSALFFFFFFFFPLPHPPFSIRSFRACPRANTILRRFFFQRPNLLTSKNNPFTYIPDCGDAA
jgi:hypothetical protein